MSIFFSRRMANSLFSFSMNQRASSNSLSASFSFRSIASFNRCCRSSSERQASCCNGHFSRCHLDRHTLLILYVTVKVACQVQSVFGSSPHGNSADSAADDSTDPTRLMARIDRIGTSGHGWLLNGGRSNPRLKYRQKKGERRSSSPVHLLGVSAVSILWAAKTRLRLFSGV